MYSSSSESLKYVNSSWRKGLSGQPKTQKKKKSRSIRSRYAAVTISIFLSQEKGRTGGEGEQKRNNTVIVRSVTRVCMCARLDTRVEKVREKIGTAKKSAII